MRVCIFVISTTGDGGPPDDDDATKLLASFTKEDPCV